MTELQLEKAREQWVYKHNALIQNVRFDLSAMEQKIVLFLCSKIGRDTERLEWINFKIDDFCEIIGIDKDIMKSGNTMRSYVKNTVKAMADKSFWIKGEGDTDRLCRWIINADINWKNKVMMIRLDEKLSPYLIQLQSNYFQYQLYWVLEAESKYTIPLYELFKSEMWHKVKMLFEVEELKIKLCVDKKKSYAGNRTGNFIIKCIEPAIKEINELTDIKVTYKKCKQGKTITHLQFLVRQKNSKEETLAKVANEKKRGGQIHMETPITNADAFPIAELAENIEELQSEPTEYKDCKTWEEILAVNESKGNKYVTAFYRANKHGIPVPRGAEVPKGAPQPSKWRD